jgi:hypothetical protein
MDNPIPASPGHHDNPSLSIPNQTHPRRQTMSKLDHPIRSALLQGKRLTYAVEIQILDKIFGGIPKNPEIIQKWIGAVVEDKTQGQAIAAQTVAAMAPSERGDPVVAEALQEELSEASWIGFKGDAKGLYIEGRQVKALLKECANILRIPLNLAAFKQRVAERMFVIEDRVYLDRQEPDGFEEGPVHAMTAQGPISALKRADYCKRPLIAFTVEVLNEAYVTKDKKRIPPGDALLALVDYGRNNGIGAERSQGAGRYEIITFEQIENSES